MVNTAVIDGSLLAFRAAAAGEKRTIKVKQIKSGKVKPFDNRTAFKKWLAQDNEKRQEQQIPLWQITDFEIEDVLTPIPLKQSLHIAKEIIKYILSATQSSKYEIYLDADGDTFRHKLATVQEYKGNRVGKIKPSNLQGVKDYLVLHHYAIVISGIEADDIISIRKWEGYVANKQGGSSDKIIACTFDKDDRGCMGWTFDFRKDDNGRPLMKKPVFVDGLGELIWDENTKPPTVKGYGRKYLYYQWVDEDKADNYKARKLSGERWSSKKAFEMLDKCKTDLDCIRCVGEKFFEWYSEPVTYTSWKGENVTKDWVMLAQEYLDLCRMLRYKDDAVLAEDLFIKSGLDIRVGRIYGTKG